MTIDELEKALVVGCPVEVIDVNAGTTQCGIVKAIIKRYDRKLASHIVSAEVSNTTGRSVTIASPQNIKFWYPVKEGENK